MSRRKSHPLRALTEEEQAELEAISRERSVPAEWVIRAKVILRVSQGAEYQAAAAEVGRRDGDRVAALVKRFNEEGLAALASRHGGGPAIQYGVAERERILKEVRRQPTCEHDGTATWSLSTLQRCLRAAEDGLPTVSEFTIRKVLLEAGYAWQASRGWCQTGQVVCQRKAGSEVVTDPDREAKKS
jgi:transposase